MKTSSLIFNFNLFIAAVIQLFGILTPIEMGLHSGGDKSDRKA